MFKLRTNLTAYRSPVLRIVVSTIILALIYFRKRLIHIQNELVVTISMIVFLVFIVLSILCIIVSFLEICYVFENKRAKRARKSNAKIVSEETLFKMLDENDIIEIEIISSGEIIKLGASSDCAHNSMVYYDKKYYINDRDYTSLMEIKKALAEEFFGQTYKIISIDGCDPKHYRDT